MDEHELAKNEYQTSIELNPNEIWFYYYFAQFLEAQSEIDAALLTYNKMVEVSEQTGWDVGWAYNLLGGFYRRIDMFNELLTSYQKAIQYHPKDALLHSYLAEIYFRLGDIAASILEYETAIGLDPDLYYVYASYAGIRYQLGDLAMAEELYKKSLELRPIDYTVLLNLGQVYEQEGKLDDARRMYQTVLSYADQLPGDAVRIAQERLIKLDQE